MVDPAPEDHRVDAGRRRIPAAAVVAALAVCGLAAFFTMTTRRGPAPTVLAPGPAYTPPPSLVQGAPPAQFVAADAPGAGADLLGDVTTDAPGGFSIRFPRGWTVARIDGRPWTVEATGPMHGRISAGVQPIPGAPRPIADARAAIESHLRSGPDTEFHDSGTDHSRGRERVWFKYTAPMPTTTGSPRMTMVHYIIPLEGRSLELRIAAPPESFDSLEALMRTSIATFVVMDAAPANSAARPPG